MHVKALFQGLPLNRGALFFFYFSLLQIRTFKRSPWTCLTPDLPRTTPPHPRCSRSTVPWHSDLTWLLLLVKHEFPVGSASCIRVLLQPRSCLPDLGGIFKKVDVRKRSSQALRVCFPPQRAERLRVQGWELPAAPASFP